MQVDDERLIEIPIDDITVGFDDDGLPRVDPVDPKAKAAPKEDEPVIAAEGDEPAPVEKKPKKEQPNKFAQELEEARRTAAQARAERDEAVRIANEAREAREASEQRLGKTTDVAQRLNWDNLNGAYDTIVGGIALAQNTLEQAKAAYAAAQETQNFNAAANAHEAIAEAKVQLLELNRGKANIESEIARTRRALEAEAAEAKQPKKQAEPDPQPPKKQQTPDEWIDANLSVAAPNKWLKEHREFMTDPSKHRQLLAFAQYYETMNGAGSYNSDGFAKALANEFDPQTEDDMDDNEAVEEAPKPVAKKSAAAAPVSRSGQPGNSGGGSNTIKLTQEEYATAPQLYGPSDYDLFAPEVKRKFPSWSENAARYQYDHDKKRAQKENRFSK